MSGVESGDITTYLSVPVPKLKLKTIFQGMRLREYGLTRERTLTNHQKHCNFYLISGNLLQ